MTYYQAIFKDTREPVDNKIYTTREKAKEQAAIECQVNDYQQDSFYVIELRRTLLTGH